MTGIYTKSYNSNNSAQMNPERKSNKNNSTQRAKTPPRPMQCRAVMSGHLL